MTSGPDKAADLEWVLAKLAAARKIEQPKAPVYKPPELKPIAPAKLSDREKGELRKKEEQLWHRWNTGGKKQEAYEELYKSHKRIINKVLRQFGGIEVDPAVKLSFLVDRYRKSLDTWDPAHPKKASLTTHIWNNLRGLGREVLRLQNTARFGEGTKAKITPFRAAQNELSERLGYDPSLQQIVEYTHSQKWTGKPISMKDALEVQKLVVGTYDIEGGGESVEGAGVHTIDPHMYAARLIYPSLKPDEQKVHELMYPRSGMKPVVESGHIAKTLGWKVPKVSKIKGVILGKLQQHMGD